MATGNDLKSVNEEATVSTPKPPSKVELLSTQEKKFAAKKWMTQKLVSLSI